MPIRPQFEPNPLELALAERLNLPTDKVVAGSFDLVDLRRLDGMGEVSIRWRQAMSVDGEEQIKDQHAELPYAEVQDIQDRLAGRLG
jgi:hypothetical protein